MVGEQKLNKHLSGVFNSIGVCAHFHICFDLTDAGCLSDSCAFHINRADAANGNW
jgi:hypothetical protein